MIINRPKFCFIKFTLSDRIYHIQCTYNRIEGKLWPRQILRANKQWHYHKEKNHSPLTKHASDINLPLMISKKIYVTMLNSKSLIILFLIFKYSPSKNFYFTKVKNVLFAFHDLELHKPTFCTPWTLEEYFFSLVCWADVVPTHVEELFVVFCQEHCYIVNSSTCKSH